MGKNKHNLSVNAVSRVDGSTRYQTPRDTGVPLEQLKRYDDTALWKTVQKVARETVKQERARGNRLDITEKSHVQNVSRSMFKEIRGYTHRTGEYTRKAQRTAEKQGREYKPRSERVGNEKNKALRYYENMGAHFRTEVERAPYFVAKYLEPIVRIADGMTTNPRRTNREKNGNISIGYAVSKIYGVGADRRVTDDISYMYESLYHEATAGERKAGKRGYEESNPEAINRVEAWAQNVIDNLMSVDDIVRELNLSDELS